MDDFPKQLSRRLSARKASNAMRTLNNTEGLVDFSSNDYLGLARNKAVYSWAIQLIDGMALPLNGSTGSRLLTGNHSLFSDLESLLERVHGASALVFNSGYDANVGFFSSVPQRSDLVFYDENVHASIRDGIRMGLAKSMKFRHNNLEDLQDLWQRHTGRTEGAEKGAGNPSEVYIVTESVFSMDGDSPDLEGLVDFCRMKGCRLVVDEAHALGVCSPGGKGLLEKMEIHREAFARIITFGKAMGAHGAAILGSSLLREYLMNFSRSFIYTTAMPPHAVATLLATYHFMATANGTQKHSSLQENMAYFRKQLVSRQLESYFTPGQWAIHCCLLPGNSRVKEASAHLRQAGFDVRPILSPTVAEGSERLRICLHAFNTPKEIDGLLATLADYL